MKHKSMLDELWYNYLSEQRGMHGDSEKRLIESFANDERCLRETLDDEQKILYDKMEKSLSEIGDISEKRAFIKGVKFGSAFIYEAFCKE